jgi:CMP-N-acetylneuraminic acid synthetase
MTKKIEEICFVINARLGSSRLPGKMLKPFAGTSLFELAIDKIISSKFPQEQLYLSLFDKPLKDIASEKGINIYHRSAQSVRADNTPQSAFTLPEVFEWWEHLQDKYEYYFFVNACCPLLKVSTINSFVDEFLSSDSDGLFSVIEHRRFFYRKDSSIINDYTGTEEAKITFNTKFVEPLYSAAPLRAGRLSDIGKHIYMGTFTQNNDPPLWVVPHEEAADIDYLEEFVRAEKMYVEADDEIWS